MPKPLRMATGQRALSVLLSVPLWVGGGWVCITAVTAVTGWTGGGWPMVPVVIGLLIVSEHALHVAAENANLYTITGAVFDVLVAAAGGIAVARQSWWLVTIAVAAIVLRHLIIWWLASGVPEPDLAEQQEELAALLDEARQAAAHAGANFERSAEEARAAHQLMEDNRAFIDQVMADRERLDRELAELDAKRPPT